MRENLIKIGAEVVSHAKYVIFQLAEVAVPRKLFSVILTWIGRLRMAGVRVELTGHHYTSCSASSKSFFLAAHTSNRPVPTTS